MAGMGKEFDGTRKGVGGQKGGTAHVARLTRGTAGGSKIWGRIWATGDRDSKTLTMIQQSI